MHASFLHTLFVVDIPKSMSFTCCEPGHQDTRGGSFCEVAFCLGRGGEDRLCWKVVEGDPPYTFTPFLNPPDNLKMLQSSSYRPAELERCKQHERPLSFSSHISTQWQNSPLVCWCTIGALSPILSCCTYGASYVWRPGNRTFPSLVFDSRRS